MTKEMKSARLEQVKKAAYSVKERAEVLGHKVPLTHIYELLATTSGYRNWATMKSKLKVSLPNLFIGYDKALHSGQKVFINGADIPNHVEVVGDPSFRYDASLALAKSCMENHGSLLVVLDTDYIHLKNKIEAMAAEAGLEKEVQTVDLSDTHGPGILIDARVRSAEELGNDLAHLSTTYNEIRGSDDYLWMLRRVSLASVALSVSKEVDTGISTASLWDNLNMKKLLELLYGGNISDGLAKKTRNYVSALPGFREGMKQTQTTMDQHGYSELILNRLREPFTQYPVKFEKNDGARSLGDMLKSKKIVIVLLPRQERSYDREGVIGGLVLSEFVRSAEAMSGKGLRMCLVPDITGYEPAQMDEALNRATEAGACMVIGSEEHLDSPALKTATTIKERGHLVIVFDTKTRQWIKLRK